MARCTMALIAVGLLSPGLLAQPIAIDVFPSVGPNGLASPSVGEYGANAAQGVRDGGLTTGAPGTPSYYVTTFNTPPLTVLNILATNFPSWNGFVNPSAPFDGEFGNSLYFGVRITDPDGDGFQFSNLYFDITDSLDGSLSASGDFSTYDYSDSWVGVIYGPDGPELVTSGPSTQRVNELWGVGVAVSLPVQGEDIPGGPPGTGSLAAAVANIPTFSVRATYRLEEPDREEPFYEGWEEVELLEAEQDTAVIPAPPGLALGILAVAGWGFARVRLSRRKEAATQDHSTER